MISWQIAFHSASQHFWVLQSDVKFFCASLREKCPSMKKKSSLYFPLFELNAEICTYQSKYGKFWTRKHPYLDTFL